jgi:regulator of protease activity HflC (stomatin/prohibitin superfamily)
VPTDLVIGLAGLVLIGLLGVRVVPAQEKLAVLRLGRFIGTRGPGVVWILPFVDKAIRMNLDRDVPEWRSLSTEQLASEIERRVSMSGLWR